MKVLMLRNPAASVGCPLSEGETGELAGNLGRSLVSKGLAVCLDKQPEPNPEPIKAIPDQPAIAETAEPEIKADKPIRQRQKRKAIIDIKPKHKDS